jgi:hypothetical protein
MTNTERIETIVEILDWYSCLADKNQEPAPSMKKRAEEHFDILRAELQKLDESLQ